jgi:excisionase family DNA binding protein
MMPETATTSDRLLTRVEAAALLRVSPRSVDKLIKRGLLRPVLLGRRVLLPMRELHRLGL